MRLSLRFAILIALGAVALGLAACSQTPWARANDSLAALARDVASRAADKDVEYFSGLTPDWEAAPELTRQVARSGIATNYADHLVVESPSDATLAYGLLGDRTPGTSFAIELSLVDGKVRLDGIQTSATVSASSTLGTPSAPVAVSEPTLSAVGSMSVSVSVPSKRIIGDSLVSVLIGYTNTSSEGTSVPAPLGISVRIDDSENRTVFERLGPTQLTHSEFLPPGTTVYESMRFSAPPAGDYHLYGKANGVWSRAVSLQTTN